MIISWKHKGLRDFFENGSMKHIQSSHSQRLKIILQRLDAAINADDLNLPGMNFHKLKGNKKEYYAVSVSGSWRVIYKFEDGNALSVDYLNYH